MLKKTTLAIWLAGLVGHTVYVPIQAIVVHVLSCYRSGWGMLTPVHMFRVLMFVFSVR